jgi:hypothetical protein
MVAAGARQEIKKFGLPDPLSRLPADVTENRMLITKEAAALCGYSADQWRELYQSGLALRRSNLARAATRGNRRCWRGLDAKAAA